MNILFSIIIPTYNRDNFISNAINSVIKQTYKNWELIIIDDGSTDNTKNIVKHYTNQNNRIHYFFQKNAERSNARNNGIKKAKGNFICFLDSDDIYHYTHLQNFVNLIKKNNYYKALYISGVSINKYDETDFIYNTSNKTYQEFILLNTIGTPRVCISKEILKTINFNEKIKIGEDTELWTRITKKHPVFYHTKKSFIEINHSNRSIICGKACYDGLSTVKFIFQNNNIRYSVKHSILSNQYFNIAKYEIKNNNKIKAFIFTIKSIFFNITNAQVKLRINILFQLLLNKQNDKLLNTIN